MSVFIHQEKNLAIDAPGGSERFNSGALAIVAGGETRNGSGRRLRSRGHQVILRWARRTFDACERDRVFLAQ